MALTDSEKRLKRIPDNDKTKMKSKAERVLQAGTHPLDQQAQLALDLVDAGADLIQSEGGTSAKPLGPG